MIGLPDDDMGNKVHAIIHAPDADVTEEQVLQHLAERLVRYKIPRTLELIIRFGMRAVKSGVPCCVKNALR